MFDNKTCDVKLDTDFCYEIHFTPTVK